MMIGWIPRFRPAAALLAMVVAFVALSRGAAPATPAGAAGKAVKTVAEGPVIDLPPLMVEGSATPLRWRYVELPGLEVLSVCSDSTTREFLRRYYRQHHLLTWLIPQKYQGRSSVPDAYILFNEDIHRANSNEIVSDMVNRETDRKETTESAEKERARASRETPRIRFLPNMRLLDVDSTCVFVIVRESEEDSLTFSFTLDRVGQLLQQRLPSLPAWLIVGIAGIYTQSNLREDILRIDPATWLNRQESEAFGRDEQRPRALLPIEDMLTWRPGRKMTDAGDMDRLWRTQCTLFVRWAMIADDSARRDALWTFVDRLEKEPLTEALFEECFKLGYSDMRDALSDYLPDAVGEQRTIGEASPDRPPPIPLRDATPAEVARLRGDWERMEITFVRKKFPDLVSKYVDQARATLRKAYDKGERDPRMMAVMGLMEVDADNRVGAIPYLEAAALARVVRPRVYFELGFTRFAAITSQKPNPAEARLTPEEVEQVLNPLWTAHRQWPPLAMVYTLMAEVWMKSDVRLGHEELQVLADAVGHFPYVSQLVLRAAHLHAVNGYVPDAIRLLEFGEDSTDDPASREMLAGALAKLKAEGTGAGGNAQR
ncbi:MAG: hypothetical protein U1F61_17140 [Opitutaceae bacterium]